jgi:hypothetical protein
MDEGPTFGELPPEEPPDDIFDGFVDEEYDAEGEPVTAGRPPPAVRHESLQQRENFASTGRFTLYDGPKVRVTGRTLLIHGKTKGPRVRLQLVKEKRTKYIIPPYEATDRISLDGDGVESLYSRLTEARQNLGEKAATDYFVVNTANPNIENLETLLRAVAENPAQFIPLTTMVGAEQLDALHAVANIGRFRRARDELAGMVEENPPESVFQKWFEDNEWVFGTEYIERLTKRSRHIAADSIIDLMFKAVDGFVDIFELKRPGPEVFVQPPGRTFLIPSGDLNAAFGQAVSYLASADAQTFINQVTRDVPMYRPRVRLVIGRSNHWTPAHYRVYRDTVTAWNRIELLTYDMVLRRIDLLIQTMTNELHKKTAPVEDAPDDLDDLPF